MNRIATSPQLAQVAAHGIAQANAEIERDKIHKMRLAEIERRNGIKARMPLFEGDGRLRIAVRHVQARRTIPGYDADTGEYVEYIGDHGEVFTVIECRLQNSGESTVTVDVSDFSIEGADLWITEQSYVNAVELEPGSVCSAKLVVLGKKSREFRLCWQIDGGSIRKSIVMW